MEATFNTDVIYSKAEVLAKALAPRDWEDVLQESVLRAWRTWAAFDGRNLSGWLRTIVRSVVNDAARQAKRQPQCVRLDDVAEAGRWDNRDDGYSEPVARALSALPREFRDALVLYAEGWQYSDIAKALSVPVGTVRSRIARARAAMRVALGTGRQS